MSAAAPALLWLRRDLRLSDHPALLAACEGGRAVIPVFIYDETVAALGAAPRWRLEQSLAALMQALEARGSRLILRRGPALDCLEKLRAETGAGAVHWMRAYDPLSIARDKAVKAALTARGLTAQSVSGALLHQPWEVQTGQGGPYRVFTPFWKAIRDRAVPAPQPAPAQMIAPAQWPVSDRLDDWGLSKDMNRGAAVLAGWHSSGEDAAQDRLAGFLKDGLAGYGANRDALASAGGSCLSDHLALGEISVRQCWHAVLAAREHGLSGAEPFLRQLGWRDFAAHLLFHFPAMETQNWREGWEAFPWNRDATHPHVQAWQQGRTGVDIVDAGMRQMMVTGRMHNRTRMVVASYLTKHLLTDWRIGLAWFAEHLTDWDAANNAMGWQWVAGTGPDAAPYFRIMNPELQAEKFDGNGAYRRRWIAERQAQPPATALAYFEAIPRAWQMTPQDRRPAPVVGLKAGREAALAALASIKG